MRTLFVCVPLALLLCAPSPVDAQQVPRPARPYRGLFGGGPPIDPNRDRHELTLTASLTGGYGDVIPAGGSTVGPAPTTQSGATGQAEGQLRYWFGRTGRFFSAEGRGSWLGYTGIDVDPMIGGSGQVRAETGLGRRSDMHASLNVSYDPTLVLGAFTPLLNDVDPTLLPETGQASGVTDQTSWGSAGTVGLNYRWNPRQTTNGSLGYSKRTYLDEFGFDSRSLSAGAGHNWLLSRYTSFRGTYRFSDSSLVASDDSTIPLTEHTLEFGLSYTRRLSATREFHLSGGGGATYVDTLSATSPDPLQYWTPSGHGTFRLGVGRSWAVSVDYRRGVTVLQGVTLEAFSTDAVVLATNGALGRRADLSFSGAYSSGSTDAGPSVSRFGSYGGNVQTQYALSRCCAITASYDYYYYRLRDVPNVPLSFPSQYDSNAIRFGVVVSLPLYGSYAGGTERGGSRGRD